MIENSYTRTYRILLDFLNKPLDKKIFIPFFNMAFHLTKGYLLYLQKLGYKFPLKSYERQALNDLVIDILGTFLQSKPGRPYYIIFDYLRSRDCFPTGKAEPGRIFDEFTILLRRFIRQEISKLINEENPQVAKLKRRFKETLNKAPYHSFKEGTECICLYSNKDNLRKDKPKLKHEELLSLVREALNQSKNRTDWCRKIFDLLDRETDRRNYIEKHRLLSAVIAVNIENVELEGATFISPDTPQKELLTKAVDETRQETLSWVEREPLQKYIDKGKITPETATRLLKAVDRFLADFGQNGDSDLITVYFREIAPEITQKEYLKEYKNVFETLINKAREDFIERLKKNPTIRAFGDYYNFE
ncbi:MAG: hypothetical protein JXA92_06320 [candidate division Zixibacteria bacterium]|nr:hypothetical protein [candidate division Zixibacteria bacterium]